MTTRHGCGGRTRTYDLRVMSPTSFQLLYSAIYIVRCRVMSPTSSRLRCPIKFSGLRFSSILSTAAHTAPSLHLPPAALGLVANCSTPRYFRRFPLAPVNYSIRQSLCQAHFPRFCSWGSDNVCKGMQNYVRDANDCIKPVILSGTPKAWSRKIFTVGKMPRSLHSLCSVGMTAFLDDRDGGWNPFLNFQFSIFNWFAPTARRTVEDACPYDFYMTRMEVLRPTSVTAYAAPPSPRGEGFCHRALPGGRAMLAPTNVTIPSSTQWSKTLRRATHALSPRTARKIPRPRLRAGDAV